MFKIEQYSMYIYFFYNFILVLKFLRKRHLYKYGCKYYMFGIRIQAVAPK